MKTRSFIAIGLCAACLTVAKPSPSYAADFQINLAELKYQTGSVGSHPVTYIKGTIGTSPVLPDGSYLTISRMANFDHVEYDLFSSGYGSWWYGDQVVGGDWLALLLALKPGMKFTLACDDNIGCIFK